jgi:hypothetical protein
VDVGFVIECDCYEFDTSLPDSFGIENGLEAGLEHYVFNPMNNGTILLKFKRKKIEIITEVISEKRE